MILRQLFVVCLIYLTLVLQSSSSHAVAQIFDRLWLPGMALIACITITRGATGLVWAAVLGLGIDCLGADRLGVNVVVVTLVAGMFTAIQSESRSPTIPMLGVVSFVSTFAWRGGAAMAQAFLDRQPIDRISIFSNAAINGISTAVIVVSIATFGYLVANAFRPGDTKTMSLSNRWSMLTEQS